MEKTPLARRLGRHLFRVAVALALAEVRPLDAVEVRVVHPSLDQRIGYPAIIAPGDASPAFRLISPFGGTLAGGLFCTETDAALQPLAPRAVVAGEPLTIGLDGPLPPTGVYHVELRLSHNEVTAFRTAYSFAVLDPATLPADHSLIAHPAPGGRMRYIPDVRGNRVPDFSGVGCRSGTSLPEVPTVLRVEPQPGDATARLQAAIDQVSARAPDANVFRGALELAAGLYEIEGRLRIQQSGVVLRGAGAGPPRSFLLDPAQNLSLEAWRASLAGTTATVLVATGPAHRPLLNIAGDSGITVQADTATEIVDEYVPVGRRWFHVSDPAPFKVGDTIQLKRRGNPAWIAAIKMDRIPARPDGRRSTQWEPFSLHFQFTITAIDGDRITVDSGLVAAVEQRWGGGQIRRYDEGGRIRDVGVENLRAVSFWRADAHGKDDTRHADQFVVFHRLRDGWARRIVAEHFTPRVGGTFECGRESLGVTIAESSALAADRSFYGGTGYDESGRTYLETGVYVGRYGFHFSGQNGLVRDCYALNLRHAYVVCSRVAGPNVFYASVAERSLTHSEPHHRWAAGGLYDNVQEDSSIALMNRLNFGSGHGWAAANYAAWNTRGTLICEQPPTAQNWAIGHVGERAPGPFHALNLANHGQSFGYWESLGRHVEPVSLYTRQVAER